MITAMKALLAVVLAAVVGQAAFGAGLSQVEVNGNSYSNITDVHLGSGGLVIILFPGGGTSVKVDKLPTDFLASWNIGQKAQAAAQAAQAAAAENSLDRAIESGSFREVEVSFTTHASRRLIGWSLTM